MGKFSLLSVYSYVTFDFFFFFTRVDVYFYNLKNEFDFLKGHLVFSDVAFLTLHPRMGGLKQQKLNLNQPTQKAGDIVSFFHLSFMQLSVFWLHSNLYKVVKESAVAAFRLPSSQLSH